MAQQEEALGGQPGDGKEPPQKQEAPAKGYLISKKVSDHLANERTFLAWTRTGLAVIGFGFVVERFGLLIRDIVVRINGQSVHTGFYSTIIGITLTLLGTAVLVVALLNFLQTRSAIDRERFHPPRIFAIVLTCLTCLIGLILAVYLYLAA
jgi:putative membrane protein